MFLLKHLLSFLFIVSYLDMGKGKAAPKDVHIHLYGLDQELAKDDALGETEAGMFGWIQSNIRFMHPFFKVETMKTTIKQTWGRVQIEIFLCLMVESTMALINKSQTPISKISKKLKPTLINRMWNRQLITDNNVNGAMNQSKKIPEKKCIFKRKVQI